MIWLRVLYYSWKYRSWPTKHSGFYFWAIPRLSEAQVAERAKRRALMERAVAKMPKVPHGTVVLWWIEDDDGGQHWLESMS